MLAFDENGCDAIVIIFQVSCSLFSYVVFFDSGIFLCCWLVAAVMGHQKLSYHNVSVPA